MAKYKLRQQALELRKKGMSYSQIKKELGLSKSTLSNWLHDHPLSDERMRQLRDFSEIRIEKFRQTMQKKRQKRLDEIYKNEKERNLPLSLRELYIAGLFLYWGEGGKGLKWAPAIHNTNPQVIKFALYWFMHALGILKKDINVRLHLYSDMGIEEETRFWSQELKLPLSQFKKPYVKKSTRAEIDYKGGFGHGTCGLMVHGIVLKEKILMAIKRMADYYSDRI